MYLLQRWCVEHSRFLWSWLIILLVALQGKRCSGTWRKIGRWGTGYFRKEWRNRKGCNWNCVETWKMQLSMLTFQICISLQLTSLYTDLLIRTSWFYEEFWHSFIMIWIAPLHVFVLLIAFGCSTKCSFP